MVFVFKEIFFMNGVLVCMMYFMYFIYEILVLFFFLNLDFMFVEMMFWVVGLIIFSLYENCFVMEGSVIFFI